jgi:hypothetical protein
MQTASCIEAYIRQVRLLQASDICPTKFMQLSGIVLYLGKLVKQHRLLLLIRRLNLTNIKQLSISYRRGKFYLRFYFKTDFPHKCSD